MPRIPANRIAKRVDRTDNLGDLWATMNMDLTTNLGKMRISPRLMIAAKNDDSGLSNLGVPVGFRWYNDRYYTVAGTRVFSNSAPSQALTGNFTEEGSGPTDCSSDFSDIEIFNGSLYVTRTGANVFSRFNGSAWSSVNITGANGSSPHMMTTYANRIYVTNNNNVYSMDASDVAGPSLTLQNAASNAITFIRSTSSRIWIGVVNTRGGKGAVYAWNGEQTSVNEVFKLDSSGALSGIVKDDVLYIMDANGKLMAFNGGTFIEVARLPTEMFYLKNANSSSNNRFIHPNGMAIIENRIHAFVDNQYRNDGQTISENLSSGIWEYDENIGLYHKYSVSLYQEDGGIVRDYGQNRVSRVGAIAEAKSNSSAGNDNGSFFAGCSYFTGTGTTQNAIFFNDLRDTVAKAGYLVTTKVQAAEIEDDWGTVFLRHKRLPNSSDRFIVKYRKEEKDALEVNATWASVTAIATTTDVSDWSVGDEVEITLGHGSGRTAHITSITDDGTTWIIELDETFPITPGQTIKARFQSWKKIGTQAIQGPTHLRSIVGEKGSWIQFKVCAVCTGKNEIDDIIITSKPAQVS